jgi:hypothetical protein
LRGKHKSLPEGTKEIEDKRKLKPQEGRKKQERNTIME